MVKTGELTGHYFTYCQWCKNDNNCVLLHHEFLGLPTNGKVDATPYPGHENLRWHMSGFQSDSRRGMCFGRIHATGNIFYPLGCDCGTVISSLTFSGIVNSGYCAKFEPNEKGKLREQQARSLSRKRHQRIDQILHLLPPPDENYRAEMEQ